MGLRTASVRRPHAAVMAPALTDAAQSQTFKLPPKVPGSPINGYEPQEPCCKGFQRPDEITDDIIHAVDSLNTLALASETLLINKCLTNLAGASDNSENIMNNSPPPMGDQGDKMGLQKTGLDTVSSLQREKSSTDVDQLFNNLSSVLPEGITSELGQNEDDFMQVIKSIEGQNSDESEEFQITGTDLTNNLSSFEKELLNDVDLMTMSTDQPDDLDSVNNLKETQTKELLQGLQKKHSKLERRLYMLKKRVHKIQSRHLGQHISGEVAGVFEHVHRQLKKTKEAQETPKDANQQLSTLPPPGETTEEKTEKEKPQPMSYSSTKNLVRKLEMTTILQANSASKQKQGSKYFGSGSVEPPTFKSNVANMVNIPPWSTEDKVELQKVTGQLQSQIKMVQKEVDSEATESSSGGESCDELQNYNNPHQQYLSIQKRALWKYTTDRAAIAARWTWLQAQISDLEYRIRQHTDLHKQIRSNKGAVTLGGASPPHGDLTCPASPTTVNGYRAQMSDNNNVPTTPESATASRMSECAGGSGTANGALNVDYQCARTRPLVNFRKRKLLQTSGLHTVSKKAARPSTLRCGCVSPTVPCAVCTGRQDPTHPRDPPETLGVQERIALLDPCYHPVFSLPDDASKNIHMEAIMKTWDWQQRTHRMKTVKILSRPEKLEKSSMEHRSKKLEHRKKYNRLLKPSTMSALSAKLKNKLKGRKTGRYPMNRLNRKRHNAKMAMSQMHSLASDEEVESIGSNGFGSTGRSIDSPNLSPLLQMQSISGYNKKNRIDSYDIDNIVIPYSVAASTRVEKLPYKEILTPKWRLVEPDVSTKPEIKNNGAVRNPSQDEDVEDLSEESVIARHDRCEHDEKKKFLSYLKLPIGYGRSRSHKRTDSRAESSGANTPDPMSPHPVEPYHATSSASTSSAGAAQQDGGSASSAIGKTAHGSAMSPITSPPATPLPVQPVQHQQLHVAFAEDAIAHPSSSSMLRRRTISQTRYGRDRDLRDERCNTPDVIEVAPYERRTFPLNEETYERMLRHMPEDHQFKTNIRAQDSEFVNCTESYLDEKMHSPGSESTESALGDEDPNDPEWIDMERPRDRHKR